jgi:hypothetical protein
MQVSTTLGEEMVSRMARTVTTQKIVWTVDRVGAEIGRCSIMIATKAKANARSSRKGSGESNRCAKVIFRHRNQSMHDLFA